MKIHSFKVTPNLPKNMKFLEELSNNMWFAWNWPAITLFLRIDEKLWEESQRTPKWLMASVSQKRLEELSKDKKNDVTWFTSSFDHFQKKQIVEKDTVIDVKDNYHLKLIYAKGYKGYNIPFLCKSFKASINSIYLSLCSAIPCIIWQIALGFSALL